MKLLSAPRSPLAPSPHPARRMRIVATGMLVAMALLFVIARATVHIHPALGFVQAFAEAAMVGGLADWFAVTALFRHPFGIPIPHTAIIPKNKDRIADFAIKRMRDICEQTASNHCYERPFTDGRLLWQSRDVLTLKKRPLRIGRSTLSNRQRQLRGISPRAIYLSRNLMKGDRVLSQALCSGCTRQPPCGGLRR